MMRLCRLNNTDCDVLILEAFLSQITNRTENSQIQQQQQTDKQIYFKFEPRINTDEVDIFSFLGETRKEVKEKVNMASGGRRRYKKASSPHILHHHSFTELQQKQ